MTIIFDDIREAIERSAGPVTMEEILERRTTVATRRLHHRHLLLAGVSIPAAVAVAAVAILQGGDASGPTAVSASLVLDRMGRVADTQFPLQPGAGQFVYVDRQGLGYGPGGYGPGDSRPTFWVSFSYQVQTWTSTTASGQTVQSDGASTPARPSDQSIWEAAGRPTLAGATSRSSRQAPTTSTQVDGVDISTLSSDTNQLAHQLLQVVAGESAAAQGPSGGQPVTILSVAQDLLNAWQLQPAVRSAIFRVLSTQPGVTVQPDATNHAGQLGTGISDVQDGVKMQIIFDPTTSEEIGYSSTIVGSAPTGYPASATGIAGWVVIAPPVLVNSLGATS
jgi:hypothetical protein